MAYLRDSLSLIIFEQSFRNYLSGVAGSCLNLNEWTIPFFWYADRKLDVTQSREITSENKEEEEKRQHFSDSAFGTNPQPVLERVEFKVCIKAQ